MSKDKKETTVELKTDVKQPKAKAVSTKPSVKTETIVETQLESEDFQELNLDQKVTVKTIAGWKVGFARTTEVGDVTIPPNGTVRLSRNEIISQIRIGNRLFLGIDEIGSHATLYIDDNPCRQEVEFDSLDGSRKQIYLTEQQLEEMFKIDNLDEFIRTLHRVVVTQAEKSFCLQTAKKLMLNDYAKVTTIENHTGYKY